MGVKPADKIAAEPGARAIFMPGGRFLRPGETLVQHDLARTLARIAEEGARVFYDGEIAEAIGRDFETGGGLFTTDDLRWATPVVETPLRGSYRDYTLLTDEPPGLGLILLEILQVLEAVDLRSLGWNSPAYLDLVARTMQFAFADAARVLGASASEDPRQLLAPSHTDAVRARVQAGEFAHGSAPAPAAGTTHLAAVDRDRNAVSWVHSSGSGSGVVTPGLGFMHNDHMIMFDPGPGRPGSLAPRTVPVHGGGPVIILREGRPWLAIGSPAGALKTTAIAQVLLSMVEFGLPLQAAVSAPRIHTQHEARVVMVEPSFPSGLGKALAQRGHRVVVSDYTARISAIMVSSDGSLTGGADPRGGGGLEWC
jgi:gamma-glutamyltranspeptidase/glutathione hydrolase